MPFVFVLLVLKAMDSDNYLVQSKLDGVGWVLSYKKIHTMIASQLKYLYSLLGGYVRTMLLYGVSHIIILL